MPHWQRAFLLLANELHCILACKSVQTARRESRNGKREHAGQRHAANDVPETAKHVKTSLGRRFCMRNHQRCTSLLVCLLLALIHIVTGVKRACASGSPTQLTSSTVLSAADEQIVSGLPTVAPGLNVRYALVSAPSKRISAVYEYNVQAPRLTATTWVMFAARPPNLPGQEILSARTVPEGAIIEVSESVETHLAPSDCSCPEPGVAPRHYLCGTHRGQPDRSATRLTREWKVGINSERIDSSRTPAGPAADAPVRLFESVPERLDSRPQTGSRAGGGRSGLCAPRFPSHCQGLRV